MQDLNVTYLQYDIVWEDRNANSLKIEEQIAGYDKPTDILILPEMFDTGFSMEPGNVDNQNHEDTVSWMKKVAAEREFVVCGSIMAKEGEKYYNRFYWVTPEGDAPYYDKKHLFRMGMEPRHYSAGSKKMIVEYKGWKILPLICYDLRFPVWSANQLTEDGPEFDLLIYVANWPSVRRDVWISLLKARALENQAYCIGVNRVGIDGSNLLYKGDSTAYDAKGQYIGRSAPGLEDINTVLMKKETLEKFRTKFPVYKDWDQFSI